MELLIMRRRNKLERKGGKKGRGCKEMELVATKQFFFVLFLCFSTDTLLKQCAGQWFVWAGTVRRNVFKIILNQKGAGICSLYTTSLRCHMLKPDTLTLLCNFVEWRCCFIPFQVPLEGRPKLTDADQCRPIPTVILIMSDHYWLQETHWGQIHQHCKFIPRRRISTTKFRPSV